MALRRTPIALGVLAAAVLSGGAAYAVLTTAHSSGLAPDRAATVSDFTPGSPMTVFLEADLNGRNEQLRAPRSPMGDPRGTAMEVLRIRGNQVAFEITWQNMSTPIAARMHAGAAGMAGPAVIPVLGAPLPGTVTAVAGSITVDNPKLLAQLANNPGQFYLNLGTTMFPNGAVRGQFRKIGPVDFQRIMHVGQFAALADGGQEVAMPDKPAGDPNARATAFLGMGATSIGYAVSWTGANSPTAATVNQGAVGATGNPVATLFSAPRGLPPGITAVAGMVTGVPAKAIAAVKANPAMFYLNLVTARFAGGAARGQIFLATMPTTTMPTTTMPSTTKPTTSMTKPTMPSMPSMSSMPSMTNSPGQSGISTPPPPHW